MLRDYPTSLADPLESLDAFIEEDKQLVHKWRYEGDLERDYFNALAQIQKAAEDEPYDGEIDFRS